MRARDDDSSENIGDPATPRVRERMLGNKSYEDTMKIYRRNTTTNNIIISTFYVVTLVYARYPT